MKPPRVDAARRPRRRQALRAHVARRRAGGAAHASVRRVGHTGTLDPLATGVLPLVVGRATRLAQFMTGGGQDLRGDDRLRPRHRHLRRRRRDDRRERAGAGRRGARRRHRGAARAAAADAAGLLGEEDRRRGGASAGAPRHAGRAGARSRSRSTRPSSSAPRARDVRLRCGCRPGSTSGRSPTTSASPLGRRRPSGRRCAAPASAPFGLEQAVPWVDLATGAEPRLKAAVVPVERLLTDLPAAHLTPRPSTGCATAAGDVAVAGRMLSGCGRGADAGPAARPGRPPGGHRHGGRRRAWRNERRRRRSSPSGPPWCSFSDRPRFWDRI